MSKLIIRDGILWRQLTCCAVIYTLIIQALLLGFLGAEAAASPGGKGPAFEFCLNGDRDHDHHSGHDKDGHSCLACPAGGQTAVDVPPAVSWSRLFTTPAQPLLPPLEQQVSPPVAKRAAPRGPPLTA